MQASFWIICMLNFINMIWVEWFIFCFNLFISFLISTLKKAIPPPLTPFGR